MSVRSINCELCGQKADYHKSQLGSKLFRSAGNLLPESSLNRASTLIISNGHEYIMRLCPPNKSAVYNRICIRVSALKKRESFQSNQIIPHGSNFTAFSHSNARVEDDLAKSESEAASLRGSTLPGTLNYTYCLTLTSTLHPRFCI